MATIIHIYEVDRETTDEFVDKNFTQRFIHMHLESGKTIVLRALDFAGKRLRMIEDSDEITELMEEISKEISEEDRMKIGKFLSNG